MTCEIHDRHHVCTCSYIRWRHQPRLNVHVQQHLHAGTTTNIFSIMHSVNCPLNVRNRWDNCILVMWLSTSPCTRAVTCRCPVQSQAVLFLQAIVAIVSLNKFMIDCFKCRLEKLLFKANNTDLRQTTKSWRQQRVPPLITPPPLLSLVGENIRSYNESYHDDSTRPPYPPPDSTICSSNYSAQYQSLLVRTIISSS
jgi:hypothetical protein